MNKPTILFDGVCNLCNGVVQFIIRRDKKGVFMFAALQSEAARKLLIPHNISTDEIRTAILIDNGKTFQKSTAVLKILSRLPRWGWTKVFWIVPKVIRDFVYELVSKNRYRIFGKKDSCMIPTTELKARFL